MVFEEAEAQTYLGVIAASQWRCRALAPHIGALRGIKSRWEVEVMKASAEISVGVHAKVCCIQNGVVSFADGRVRKDDALCPAFTASQSEVDLRVHFEYICARGCAERPAYVPVVASG